MSWPSSARPVRTTLLAVLLALLTSALCSVGGLLAAPAQAAPAAAHARCVPVAATGTGQDLGNGQTTATVSVGGVSVGTTSASFTITGSDGTTVYFDGPITLTGLGGTLTAEVTGTLEAATGDFTSTSTSLTGTGALSAVTGQVTLTGHEDLATGAFTESITGDLCLPVGHRH